MGYSISDLNKELENVMTNQSDYHSDMDRFRNFYLYSAFFPSKNGQKTSQTDHFTNLLRVYADKNIHFTSAFPTIKIPTTGATVEERQSASLREKAVLGVWRKSNGRLLQRQWANDGTMFSAAVAETSFDLKKRCVVIRRYDPRYCFWQVSNGNERRVVAFWAVYPITKDEAISRYGVTPTSQPISTSVLSDSFLRNIDGKEWYLMAIRWDDKVRVAWVGDKQIEEPHEHMMGFVPVDLCTPFDNGDTKGRGAFYLEPLIGPQANLNRTLARRDAVVKRMSSPVVWGRGIIAKQLDDVREGMANGGFIGLKQGGELGLLQLNDVKLLNEHAQDIREDMLRLSGFSQAAMGELAGANTSGDALGMYFTPTQRHIENQNIAWVSFYESINSKILKLYDIFAKTGEKFSLSGFSSHGTILPLRDSEHREYSNGGYTIEFSKEDISGNYDSLVMMNSVTPKNELEERRFWMEAATQKIVSRTTAFENIGIESPEDELALLTQEQSEPAINPQGMQQVASATQQLSQMQEGASPDGLPKPLASEISAHGRVV